MSASRLVQVADVVTSELDGHLLLLRPGSTDVLHLDAVATVVWRLLETGRTRAELTRDVAELYGVDVAQVEVDLGPALATLLAHGLVVEVS